MGMSSKKHQIPAIRCEGFTDAWEQRKLGDVYTERNKRGNDSLKILSVSIHHGVSNEELDSNILGKEVRRSEDKSLYKHVYLGDLVLNMMRAWQGAVGVVKSEAMVSPAYITAVPSAELYPLFMDFYLRRDEAIGQMNNLSYGVTDFRKRLYWDSFVKVLCHIPTVAEQKKITAFFTHLDETIALHQRQLYNYKELKKTMLQNIFNQELRFKDQNGHDYPDWEEKKLGEIADIEKGTQINKDSLSQIESKELYPVYNGGITPSGFHSDYNREPGTIIVSEGGNSCGYVNYVSEHFWSGGHNYTIRKKNEKINEEYLFQLLKFNETKIMALRVGTGLPNIQKPSLVKYVLLISSDESEQQKIADFLSILDVRLEQLSKKVELLKEQKKGLMQQMFM